MQRKDLHASKRRLPGTLPKADGKKRRTTASQNRLHTVQARRCVVLHLLRPTTVLAQITLLDPRRDLLSSLPRTHNLKRRRTTAAVDYIIIYGKNRSVFTHLKINPHVPLPLARFSPLLPGSRALHRLGCPWDPVRLLAANRRAERRPGLSNGPVPLPQERPENYRVR